MAKSMKGSPFRTPTMEQVEKFMNEAKPDWPSNFCLYYSQRFVNYYVSVGWIVGKKMMKDWRAAFWGQWANVKFREDKEMLEKCLNDVTHRAKMAQARAQKDGMFAEQYGTATVAGEKPAFFYLEFYQNLMESWRQGQLTWKQLTPHYDRLKALGIMRLPKAQIDAIFVEMGNDRDRGKGLSVVRLFENITAQQITLKNFYDKIHAQRLEAGAGQ